MILEYTHSGLDVIRQEGVIAIDEDDEFSFCHLDAGVTRNRRTAVLWLDVQPRE
jgi:hypothetical protein